MGILSVVNLIIIEAIQLFRSIEVPYASELVDRLDDLYEASVEEHENNIPGYEQDILDFSSLISFFLFMDKYTILKEPDIVLSYEGYIRASWCTDRKELFAVMFLPNGLVEYVIFCHNDHQKKMNRIFDVVSKSETMYQIQSFEVDWIYQK